MALALWLPVLLAAHAFAAIWLVQAAQVAWPGALRRLLRLPAALVAAAWRPFAKKQVVLDAARVVRHCCTCGRSPDQHATAEGRCGDDRAEELHAAADVVRRPTPDTTDAVGTATPIEHASAHVSYNIPRTGSSRALCAVRFAGNSACSGVSLRLPLPPGQDPEEPHADIATLSGIAASVEGEAGAPSSSEGTRSTGTEEALATAVKLRASRVAPAHLEWRDLGCSYQGGGGKAVPVLQGVYGRASAGEMQALLGPSGAGKSTLMDMLACRKKVGDLTGSLLLDGSIASPRAYIKRTSYVPQDDAFAPMMTARESLLFAAGLVLPLGGAARGARVDEVLSVLGLAGAAHTVVGGALPGGLSLRGLSGGERRRLSLAVGVLQSPSVLLLDEPTSGLDAAAALNVATHLREMATQSGHVVIASIHQPRGAIWALFDTVTLLSKGRLLYTGPTSGMAPWLSAAFGTAYDPLAHGSACDWALDLVASAGASGSGGDGDGDGGTALTAAASAFLGAYLSSAGIGDAAAPRAEVLVADAASSGSEVGPAGAGPLPALVAPATALQVDGSSSGSGSSGSDGGSGSDGDGGGERVAGPAWRARASMRLRRFVTLLWREVVVMTRNPADVAGRTLTFSWVALFVGLVYFNLPNGRLGDDGGLDGSDAGTAMQLRLNTLFNNTAFFMLMPYVSMSLFTSDRRYFLAESSAKLYGPGIYYMAKVIATLPFNICAAAVYALIVYGLAGLNPDPGTAAQSVVLQTLLSLIAVQVLHLAATLAPNQDAAFMLSIAWTAVNLLMSNFFITYDQMRLNWLSQLRWLSAMGYTFDGLAQLELMGALYNCSGGAPNAVIDLLPALLPNTTLVTSPLVTGQLSQPGAGCVADTSAVLEFLGLSRPIAVTTGILLGYLIIVHLATYAALRSLARHAEQR
ncbi:hypothetical protein FOA52_002333 [Chlamydomonas sp. UWO 241]|nr:hypothetical protein FOA52_002333 [Chlamydomonas sp. UWO 241]